jgi:hypothetical protein
VTVAPLDAMTVTEAFLGQLRDGWAWRMTSSPAFPGSGHTVSGTAAAKLGDRWTDMRNPRFVRDKRF